MLGFAKNRHLIPIPEPEWSFTSGRTSNPVAALSSSVCRENWAKPFYKPTEDYVGTVCD